MFKWLVSKKEGNSVSISRIFTISGMHCSSCSLLIDGELEDEPGVVSARTNYVQGSTQVTFDPQLVSEEKLQAIITKLGYTVVAVS